MPTNILALYDQEGIAHQVIDELVKAGCDKNDVTFISPRQGELSDTLSAWGVSQQDAGTYSEAVSRGKALVRARVAEDRADQIAGILVKRGARKLSDIQQELQQSPGKLQTAEEELKVGKTQQTAQVAARTKVSEQQVEKTIPLREERIQAESRPADRKLSPEEADKVFQEGSVEMTETREVPEVSKQAKVTQEVHLNKEATQREETIRDTVRKSEVQVERKDKDK